MDGTALDHMLSEILPGGEWTAHIEATHILGHYKAIISRDGMTLSATGSTPTTALYAAALNVLSNGVVSLNRVCREATPD